MKKEQTQTITICPWCRSETAIIWVHGHGQCAVCKTNIDECCRGEQCDFPGNEHNKEGKNIQGEEEQFN